jgi:hypothetical protein
MGVKQKQIELENYMTPHKPKSLDFSDHNSDGKITAMDSLIAEKMAQRNLDIEQLQNSQYNTSNFDPEKWLLSAETSVKKEKPPIQNSSSEQPTNNRLKHINIDDNNNISLPKKVSWSDQDRSTNNIFNKLKRQPIETIAPDKEQNQYIQQQSIPLSEVNKEQPSLPMPAPSLPTPSPTIISPLISNNEIIKQLNELNDKIDKMSSKLDTLTNIVKELKN